MKKNLCCLLALSLMAFTYAKEPVEVEVDVEGLDFKIEPAKKTGKKDQGRSFAGNKANGYIEPKQKINEGPEVQYWQYQE